MRFLGIDYGTKRVGLALSDESGAMAFPHSVVPNDSTLLDTIESLISQEHVEAIVIGQSMNSDGSPNKVQSAIEECVTDLTLRTGLPVHLEPEYYSTQEAVRFQGRTNLTDAAAASVILNSYLTRRHD